MRAMLIWASGGALLSGFSSPSSAIDTERCSAGVLRPYQAHTAIRASGGSAAQNSPRCQPKAAMSNATTGGASAAPTCKAVVCMPWASAKRRAGSQDSMTPAHTGMNGA